MQFSFFRCEIVQFFHKYILFSEQNLVFTFEILLEKPSEIRI